MVDARSLLTGRGTMRVADAGVHVSARSAVMRDSMPADTVEVRAKAMQRAHLSYVKRRHTYDRNPTPANEAKMQKAHRWYVDTTYKYHRELIRTGK